MSAFHPHNHRPLRDPAGDPVDPSPPRLSPPAGDDLDSLLRQWHNENAERAAAGRDRLLASLTEIPRPQPAPVVVRRFILTRMNPLAAAALILLATVPLLLLLISNKTSPVAVASARANVVLAPEGGRLDAFDPRGDPLGPCVLKHTDVQAIVCGPFARVTLTQKYHNPHASAIEAVYTFPLAHHAAVDRMNMTIGDRVVVGQVKERSLAREVYEAARESGRTASLLEQERPNIFTQSVANIDPGADIDITISYVEQVESRGGEYEFTFPTVVGPRYIPGGAVADGETSAAAAAPDVGVTGFVPREGVNLLAPAQLTFTHNDGHLDAATLAASLPMARPLAPVDGVAEPAKEFGAPIAEFNAAYPDGEHEAGTLYANDVGEVGGRWFHIRTLNPGEPFAQSTPQVPDADRITPTPTRPETRAGHDISISVTIDTGGPGLVDIESPLHAVKRQDVRLSPEGMPSRTNITLADRPAIPNRDFLLRWRQAAPGVVESVFTARTNRSDFFAVVLQPPNRVEDAAAVPRELVFVLDTSGSMRGRPIEESKSVARSLIGAMRPQDTFNVVTFSGDTRVLWPAPRPLTDANRDEALAFFDRREGGGGTDMMTAIQTALRPTVADDAAGEPVSPAELGAVPADGREVTVRIDDGDLDSSGLTTASVLTDGKIILDPGVQPPVTARVEKMQLPRTYLRRAAEHLHDETKLALIVRGRWITEPGKEPARALVADSTVLADEAPVRPLRIVVFLTDGYVGNDHAIINAIRQTRGTTRVFPIGIGNSVNRYLLDGMARAGGGEADYMLIPHESAPGVNTDKAIADEVTRVIERLNRRTRTPVLTHISAEFSPGLDVADVEPPLDQVPDLFEARPITLVGRLTHPGRGFITVRGQTVAGPWERTIPIGFDDLPAGGSQPVTAELGDAVVPNLWARARIDRLLGDHLTALQLGETPADVRGRVVQLGEAFGIMSPFTSFVAVDHRRMTIEGRPTLVPIPVELPDATEWDGFFSPDVAERAAAAAVRRQAQAAQAPMALAYAPTSSVTNSVAIGALGAARKTEGAIARGGPSTSNAGVTAQAPAPPEPPGASKEQNPARGGAPAPHVAEKPMPEEKARASESGLAKKPAAPADMKSLPPASPAPVELGVNAAPVAQAAPTLKAGGGAQSRPLPDHHFRYSFGDAAEPAVALPADPVIQSLAAEEFYGDVESRLNLSASLGQPAPERLAVAAGANFIAANVKQGQYVAANRAQVLFQNRYPDAPLLDAWGEVMATNAGLRIEEAATPARNAAPHGEKSDKDAAAAPASPVTATSAQTAALAARTEEVTQRERTLLRRLDQRLYDLLPAPAVNAPAPVNEKAARTPDPDDLMLLPLTGSEKSNVLRDNQVARSGDGVIVSVLVEKIDEATLGALQAVGFRIDRQLTDAKTIVGSIPIAKLEALALLPSVQRIEPATTPSSPSTGGGGVDVR